MRIRNTLWVALVCSLSFGACDACASKTPVPFKRDGVKAVDAGASKPQRAVEAPAESSVYPDGTQKIRANDAVIERPGTIRASWSHDVDGDGQADLLLITTDENSRAALEVVKHGASDASTRLPLDPYATASPCRAIAGSVTALGTEQAIASVDFLCDAAEPIAPSKAPTPSAPTPQPLAADPALDLPPPEPSATLAQTHQYVIGLGDRPRVLLHLTVEPSNETGLPALRLNLSGDDLDGDEHADVKVDAELATSADADAKPIAIGLTWLNRPTGLARDRDQPEHAIAEFGEQALRLSESKPDESLAIADKALRLQRALCRESGLARLWVDDARGLACGASKAAGSAAAAQTIALAKKQSLLAALDARASLDREAYLVDPKTRAHVAKALAAIRGDTSFRWQIGPIVHAPSAPRVRLSALSFIDEDHLLLRGPIAQSYDLQAHTVTPTGIPGSVHAVDPSGSFAIVDIVRACDGYHLRVAPASQVIGGIVTGAVTSEPLLQAEAADPSSCASSSFKKTDQGGFSLLGLFTGGALFARGAALQLVPLDPQGRASGEPHALAPNERVPALQAASAIDASAQFIAATTSEGIALIDRAAPATTKLVRSPASCNAGPVSDPALSASGRKIAMLCGGHVYVAEPAADSGP